MNDDSRKQLNNSDFAILLTDLLKEKGLNNVQAAEMTGMHSSTIGRLKSGESKPTYEDFCKICKGLKVSSEYFVNEFND